MPTRTHATTRRLVTSVALLAATASLSAPAEERRESFDKDPRWDGHNNRSVAPETIRQDFGWSRGTMHAGGQAGEIGGLMMPTAEPAWYAKPLPVRTFDDVLAASGTLFVEPGAGNALIGFFNADTAKEWRTANSLVWRINPRGETFDCHFEYGTAKWRASAGIIGVYDKVRDRMHPKALACGRPFAWSIRYDPRGNGGNGLITATMGDDTAVCALAPGHKADGAAFNRFGLLNVIKSYDAPGTLWLDDVTINGAPEDFGRDPRWEAHGNRRTYQTRVVRPRFDFGYSPTHFAGGRGAGELGGLVFRGDCRYGDRLAAYGDRLSTLTLERPLRASGKVSLRWGVSDSTTLIGFYHSAHSLWVNPSQQFGLPKDFLGLAIEGPSSEGFFFYPTYRINGDEGGHGVYAKPPYIYPDGATHDWTLAYEPSAAGGNARITVTLDGQSVSIELPSSHKALGAQFDRFGIVTPWIDGNGQDVYFDDLLYTCK